jgi:16S rRNA (adenine1518-N6/adenine1519-N6)-dimethyltransferase
MPISGTDVEHPGKVLTSLGFKPRKERGQSFLADKNVARKILESVAADGDFVVEVGPGLGALTFLLEEKAKTLKAVEIDKTLAQYLKGKVWGEGVEIIQGDFLQVEEETFASWYREAGGGIKVVGNLPYSISGPLVFRFVELRDYLSACYVMLQKEVARRMASLPGGKEYGSASVILQAVAGVKVLFSVSRNCFFPVPEVDSSFLEIDFSGASPGEINNFSTFSGLVNAAFSGRRKVIRNSLLRHLGSLGIRGKENLDRLLEDAGISPGDRPERVPVENFITLANLIS